MLCVVLYIRFPDRHYHGVAPLLSVGQHALFLSEGFASIAVVVVPQGVVIVVTLGTLMVVGVLVAIVIDVVIVVVLMIVVVFGAIDVIEVNGGIGPRLMMG